MFITARKLKSETAIVASIKTLLKNFSSRKKLAAIPKLKIPKNKLPKGNSHNLSWGANLASPHNRLKYKGTCAGSLGLKIKIAPVAATTKDNQTAALPHQNRSPETAGEDGSRNRKFATARILANLLQ
jgi:hypothetical protein